MIAILKNKRSFNFIKGSFKKIIPLFGKAALPFPNSFLWPKRFQAIAWGCSQEVRNHKLTYRLNTGYKFTLNIPESFIMIPYWSQFQLSLNVAYWDNYTYLYKKSLVID